eukprot:SAG31_NODE_2747_length_5147_cov_3.881933_5_plen_93_part_00
MVFMLRCRTTALLHLMCCFDAGTVGYGTFSFYLLWCTVKGVMKLGVRFAFFTVRINPAVSIGLVILLPGRYTAVDFDSTCGIAVTDSPDGEA